jgi:opacity protein-like surface antigen
MKITKFILYTLFAFPALGLYAQQASTPEAVVTDNKIQVSCELQTTSPVDLALLYSDDGGQSFYTCRSLSGELANQLSGRKEWVWDCVKDGVFMGNLIFKVDIRPSVFAVAPPEKLVPDGREGGIFLMPGVSLGNVASYSLMAGYARKWGGYLRVKSNFAYRGTKDDTGYQTDNFFWSGATKTGRFAAVAGCLTRLSPFCYLYAGLGYGEKWVHWETESARWIEMEDLQVANMEFETGLLFRFKKIAAGAGVNYLPGSGPEAGLSIGIIF